MATEFYAKLWYRYIAAFFCTGLALFAAIAGPLYVFDILRDANGQPAADAGIALSIMAVVLGLFSALIWFNILIRWRPLIKFYREAIGILIVGNSALDDIPLVPALVRGAWLIFSMQGFQANVGWVPWESLQRVSVKQHGFSRFLVIQGSIVIPRFAGNRFHTRRQHGIEIADAEFDAGLDDIVKAITNLHADATARETLPSIRHTKEIELQ